MAWLWLVSVGVNLDVQFSVWNRNLFWAMEPAAYGDNAAGAGRCTRTCRRC